ncbi:MAG: MFS transporter, partial [Candidatus Sedimenticola sp. 6PFRAG1]
MNSEKQQKKGGMSPIESRAAFSLAGIFSLRMMGLFMILPVFALYAEQLQGVTPLLIGVAIGAYGLTQALLQIPFGMLSDHIGRKPVIIGGLLIFALGSVVAAMADSIWGVILGRALQGSGAIAAAVMALAADLTREQNRTKAMAVIGLSIGMAFAVSLVLGPILNAVIGVPGIFWLTAVLAISGIGIVLKLVPDPRESHFHRDTEPVPSMFGKVLRDTNLLRLDFGIFVLHMILTATFIAMPLALRDAAGL